MSARDVVATQLPMTSVHTRNEWAGEILTALTAAGYRIIAPGELDRETLERAVEVAAACDLKLPLAPGCPDGASIASRQIVTDLRALAGKAGEA